MALQPRAEIAEALQWRPGWIADPVPWWLLDQLTKAQVQQLAQISLQLQAETLAAQTRAVEAAIRAVGSAR